MAYYKHNLDVIASEEKPSELYEEITEDEYNRIIDIYRELAEKQFELKRTDFKAIKYAEGYYTEEEYRPIKERRQALRDRINELKESI